MSGGFTKLFPEMIDSTIWREDMPTKIVWITMLAKASRNGVVSASVPGLADAARAEIGGFILVKKSPKAITPADLERLFPQIIREEGHVNGDVFEAMSDGVLDDAERARLHAHFCKLETFFRDAKERTAPTNEKAAQRRTA